MTDAGSAGGSKPVSTVAIVKEQSGLLLVRADAFFNTRRDQLALLIARHIVPAIYEPREFTAVGGLMIYESNAASGYRKQAFIRPDSKSPKPGYLPIVQLIKF